MYICFMMQKTFRYFLFGLGFVAVGLLLGFNLSKNNTNETDAPVELSDNESFEKFQQAIGFIKQNYVKEVDQNELIDHAIKGVMDELDPHTFFISSSEMKAMDEQMRGEFDGIGVEFSILEDTIYVVSPLTGGPSEKLGIMAGDRIVKVDGEDVTGDVTNSDVMKHLKGPKGSEVLVGIVRRGVSEILDFNITRDRIPLYSVNYAYMINDEIGYIQITRFSETTYEEFHEKLVMLKEKGMKDLVIDLRGNPGGYMERAYQIADEMLPAGKMVVSTKGRNPRNRQELISTSQISDFEQGGVIVLQDYGSASASEIVAGAIQDHDRGLIAGVRSFGKGLVQIQNKFRDNSAIRVVISEYYTPSGRCIQKPYDKTSEEYNDEIQERFESGEIYDPSKVEFPDSLKFTTANGRTVYGGGGIFPDVFIAPDTSGNSKYFASLSGRDLFRGFAYSYADKHSELVKSYPDPSAFLKKFKVDQSLVNAFNQYAESHGVDFDEDGFTRSERYIRNRIKAYIGRKLFKDDGFFPVFHEADNVIQRAVELMPQAREMVK
ncbi:MAG: S41 family peptidase [Bacteroidia bacterium]